MIVHQLPSLTCEPMAPRARHRSPADTAYASAIKGVRCITSHTPTHTYVGAELFAQTGHGREVVGVLDGVADYVLERRNFTYRKPLYMPDGCGGMLLFMAMFIW